MPLNLLPIWKTIEYYIQEGWKIEYNDSDSPYFITAPTGSSYMCNDLIRNYCSFCDENDPEWDESWCDHDQELLNEEKNAKNLLSFLKLRENISE